ncbi:hypothetical protein JD844_013992 [Phrynosoma platyrhinos]|uniref:Ig-like domain-containing protein n=1 Tax=Phrynosoma platyrhinos TaxID=52577 RepID=A0ABQ7TMR5_PHRPL|nr:hypothetical protein JD844_013992 [Phrynosoma platyrhinos]
MKIAPTDYDSSSHNTLLICSVDSFFPAKIKITWFRNGKEEEGPQVMTTNLIQNGDWTYQIQWDAIEETEQSKYKVLAAEEAGLGGEREEHNRSLQDRGPSKMEVLPRQWSVSFFADYLGKERVGLVSKENYFLPHHEQDMATSIVYLLTEF